MKPIIELKNVSVSYGVGKSNEVNAIKNIDLQIFPGEYIVFFGPSGCGKSTLLYTIAGLESATEGDVIVADRNLNTIHSGDLISFYRDTIGMVFQAFYLVAHLSAKDNMMLSKMFSGVSVAEREKRADELMLKFGITEYSDRKPGMMSGGQQQRTAIARALMNDPEIILADEPVGNLDSKNSGIVLELLAKINREEMKTVIQVTHNPKDTHYADRVFYMKDGMIERVVKNAKAARSSTGQGEMSEFERLSQMNPDLSHLGVQAKLMMRSLLMPYDITTEQRIEEIIEKFLKKEISKMDLLKYLDDSKIGAGLYSQKARRITDIIDDSTKEISKINEVRSSNVSADTQVKTEAMIVRKHLLDHYLGKCSLEQCQRLERGISARIANEISEEQFRTFLSNPIKKDGVGLNRLTAKKFSKEVELVTSK